MAMASWKGVFAALIVVIAPWPAAAQDNSLQQRRALATEMSELAGGPARYRSNFELMFANIVPGLRKYVQEHPSLNGDAYVAAYHDEMQSRLAEQFQTTIDAAADIYTEQELRDIVAFYKTPSGQSMLRKSPQVAARSGSDQGARLPDMMKGIIQRYCASIGCSPGEKDQLNSTLHGHT